MKLITYSNCFSGEKKLRHHRTSYIIRAVWRVDLKSFLIHQLFDSHIAQLALMKLIDAKSLFYLLSVRLFSAYLLELDKTYFSCTVIVS